MPGFPWVLLGGRQLGQPVETSTQLRPAPSLSLGSEGTGPARTVQPARLSGAPCTAEHPRPCGRLQHGTPLPSRAPGQRSTGIFFPDRPGRPRDRGGAVGAANYGPGTPMPLRPFAGYHPGPMRGTPPKGGTVWQCLMCGRARPARAHLQPLGWVAATLDLCALPLERNSRANRASAAHRAGRVSGLLGPFGLAPGCLPSPAHTPSHDLDRHQH